MEPRHELGSGNVFADIGMPNPDQESVKAQLTLQIYRLLRELALPDAEVPQRLGATSAQAHAMLRCRPASVPIGKLLTFLNALGQDVELTVRPAGRSRSGRVSVAVQPGG